jgi:hypothetical protein
MLISLLVFLYLAVVHIIEELQLKILEGKKSMINHNYLLFLNQANFSKKLPFPLNL